MKVLLFGASGMVGQGVLRECLLDAGVTEIVSVGRSSIGKSDPKLREVLLKDLFDFPKQAGEFRDYDACFYCLGVSSAGMSEAEYQRISYDLTLEIAKAPVPGNPGMTFTFVTGAGCDSTERGKVMWARVKGAAENALMRLPFKAAYMLRPGMIQPLHGIRSKTALYQVAYVIGKPLIPLIKKLFPNQVTSTEQVGRAMLRLVREGWPKPILEMEDLTKM